MTGRFCKDCFYGYSRSGKWFCQWTEKRSPVDGSAIHVPAEEMRASAEVIDLSCGQRTWGCGRHGIYFVDMDAELAKRLAGQQAAQKRSAITTSNRMEEC